MFRLVGFSFLIFMITLDRAETSFANGGDQNKKRQVSTLKGHYVWGAEVNTFTPCGSKKTFWVEGTPTSIEKLKTKHQSITSKPYEKIFATVVGRIDTSKEDLDGFAEDYDGLILIESVNSLSKSAANDCK